MERKRKVLNGEKSELSIDLKELLHTIGFATSFLLFLKKHSFPHQDQELYNLILKHISKMNDRIEELDF